jgi:integrase
MSIIKIVIPEFQIFTPTTFQPIENKLLLSKLQTFKEQYFAGVAEDFEVTTFYHFPLLLLPNQSLWNNANSYLLYKLESINLPDSTTLDSIADSIKYFGNYCLDTEIDYLICTRKSNSPLRRYRRHLTDRIMKGEIVASTAKSHMSNLVNFYRHLIYVEDVKFEFPPWQDREVKIMISDTGRGGYVKTVKTSDVSQAIKGKVSTQSKREHCTYEGKIIDGGELRPLNLSEQATLMTALKDLNHSEMIFIFLIGLCTGARLQTILTLRYDNFSYTPKESATEEGEEPVTEVAVYAGRYNKNGNGLVDSKDDKSITIYLPINLYTKIQVYLKSKRAIKRQEKSENRRKEAAFKRRDTAIIQEEDDVYIPLKPELEYCFLSQQGNPLYLSKSDEYAKYYPQKPSGQAVATYISERLKPKLVDLNFTGSFKFHDTRATFGMNIVDSGLELMRSTDNIGGTIDKLFRFVKVRMCHNQLSTTQQYLDFNENNKMVKEAKLGWEKHLKKMLEIIDD